MPDPSPSVAKAELPAAEAMRLHPLYRGKVQIVPKCPVRGPDDFAVWYTPGVAAPCRAIQARAELVYEYTNKGNAIAIVSDGTRVLGLGDIGPEAGLPVMEGKALLFKYLGGVDAVPLCLRTADADDLIHTAMALAPSFGGINLEDIAQPKCFRVLDALRSRMDIPVWHDDQQGTAVVVVAATIAALRLTGRRLDDARIAMIGMGAANVAAYRLLRVAGAPPAAIVACDTGGTLHPGRKDIEGRQDEFNDKWRVCRESNGDRIVGDIAAALRGADVCLAFSRPGPDVVRPEWVAAMAKDPIVFACANPVPEIWPWQAAAAGARIVATGRSDFPNQVNNSLAFPGVFRGALDVRARTITEGMAWAAAGALFSLSEERGLREDRIVPSMADVEVPVRLAVATGLSAQEEGVARLTRSREQLEHGAREIIGRAREMTAVLMREGLIPPVPASNAG